MQACAEKSGPRTQDDSDGADLSAGDEHDLDEGAGIPFDAGDTLAFDAGDTLAFDAGDTLAFDAGDTLEEAEEEHAPHPYHDSEYQRLQRDPISLSLLSEAESAVDDLF